MVSSRQFAKDTFLKLLTCNYNLKDEIDDLSNTVESLGDDIQDNSAKIEETENLVDLNDTISAKIHEAETIVQNLDNILNDSSLNTTSRERLELAENNIIHLSNSLDNLNNTVKDFKNDIMNNTANIQSNQGKISDNQVDISSSKTIVEDLEGISLCWQK